MCYVYKYYEKVKTTLIKIKYFKHLLFYFFLQVKFQIIPPKSYKNVHHF